MPLDNPAQVEISAKKVEAFLADPKNVTELLKYQAYFELAWRLAQAEGSAQSTGMKDADLVSRETVKTMDLAQTSDTEDSTTVKTEDPTKRLAALNPKTRKMLQSLSGLFKESPATLRAEEISPFQTNMKTKDVKDFFLKNPDILIGLLDGSLLDDLKDREKRSDFFRKRADEFLNIAHAINRTSGISTSVEGRLQWLLMLGASIPAFLGAVANYQAAKNNPSLEHKGRIKARAVLTMLLALTAIITIPIILMAGGTLSMGAAAAFMAIYGVGMTGRSLVLLGRSMRDVYKTFKNRKKNPDTYKDRLRYYGLECVKHAADATFFLSSAILSTIGLVALFANPISLPILAGSIAIISYVTLAVFTVAAVMQKSSSFSLEKLEKILADQETLTSDKNRRISKHFRNTVRVLDKMRGIHENYRKEVGQHPGLFVARQAKKHRKELLLAASHPVMPKRYRDLATQTLAVLKRFQNEEGPPPLYQGVSYEQKPLKGDPLGLVVKIPTKADPKTSLKAEPQDTMTHDVLQRYKTSADKIQMHLSANPSDKALCVFMDLNRAFSPLQMQACGNVNTVLRVLEAAKLADVALKIHPDDCTLIAEHTNLKLQEYFNALEQVPTEVFQGYVEKQLKKKGFYDLGTVLETIPDNWIKHKLHLASDKFSSTF